MDLGQKLGTDLVGQAPGSGGVGRWKWDMHAFSMDRPMRKCWRWETGDDGFGDAALWRAVRVWTEV